MDDTRLRTIENVTANFFFWQGLRWVPLGLALLSWQFAPRFLAVNMAVAFVISMLAGKYYSRTYGRVRTIAARAERRERWKWYGVYPAMMLSLAVDMLWKPPLLVTGIVWAIAIVLYWNSTGRGRLHYLVIAGILLSTAALPLLGIPNGKTAINFFFSVIGAAYVAGGLLDHFELTRIMGNAGTV
ncbi:MAG TPA: hypothetical protein VKB93_12120 [Thermoanaerobaculia bacterium]|nr:hypothetical protein [Thermoanaerobaculia bacterium]